MALTTTLLTIPNQSFSAILEEDAYEIDIFTGRDLSFISIKRNGEQLLSNKRAVVNEPLLLFDYQFNGHGNFQFFSNLSDYPFFDQFGISVFFIYNTKSEVISNAV